jgi:hypothetical protein
VSWLSLPRDAATWLCRRLRSAWDQRRRRRALLYRCQIVEDLPERYANEVVYLAGERANWWAAAMKCPCGCGDVIELNLLRAAKPCWIATIEADSTVSLTPSVWRQRGCRSHFVMRFGRIRWF